jgi:hypothetical protein
MKKQNFVWVDRRKVLLFVIIFSLFALFLLFILIYSKGYLTKLLCAIILIWVLYYIYVGARIKRSYIIKEGIFFYDKNIKKVFYINWNEISTISIIKTHFSGGKYSTSHKELEIIAKGNKKYRSLIFDLQGFISIIQKLNKTNLLNKKIKYK